MRPQHALMLSSLLLSLAAVAMAQSGDFFILLEDGSRRTYGDLRALSQNKCCFPVNFPFAVTYSSTNKIRLFISGDCAEPFEVRRALG
jgi:hypothetical protein